MSTFGSGSWVCQLTGRGGSPIRAEIPFASLSRRKVLNTFGSVSINLDAAGDSRSICCEAFNSTEPWRDEVILYRDGVLDYAGPIITQSMTAESASITSNDLFYWMDQRFLDEDFFGSGDLADVFRRIFDVAYSKDDSPNIDISTRQCGVKGVRRFDGEQLTRAADAMREIARTALDFTVVGRTILAGGVEVFLDTTPLLIHDDGVISAEVTRDGGIFASDVAVFGGTSVREGDAGNRVVHATGRSTGGVERYGLVQKSFTELYIEDGVSADANAAARLASVQPAPVNVKVRIGPGAAFSYEDLIPGRRADTRLSEAAGCIEVIGDMRVTNIDVTVDGSGEDVSANLVPIGVEDEN